MSVAPHVMAVAMATATRREGKNRFRIIGERFVDRLNGRCGEEPLVDATEVVVGGRKLFGALRVVVAPDALEQIADVAALAVFVDGGGYQCIDLRGVFLAAYCGEIACGADGELAVGVDFDHIVDELADDVVAFADMVGDIFVCKQAVGVFGEPFFQFFVHNSICFATNITLFAETAPNCRQLFSEC